METLSDGNTILVYEESEAHYLNLDDVVHVRFSDDGGATWSDEDKYLDDTAVIGFPAFADAGDADPLGPGDTYIFQAPNGDIWLHIWNARYSGALSMTGTYHLKSSDGGKTWTAPAKIEAVGQDEAENNYMGMTEQHFTLGSVIYMAGRVYETLYSSVKMALYKSEDNGATWTWISDMAAYADHTHEAAMEYLGNDDILVLCRDSGNAKTMRITSSDLGATWSPVYQVQAGPLNIIGRNRMFTDAHLKGQANWWTDNKLIMCGFVIQTPGVSAGRRLAIWLSEDGGYAWTEPIYLDDADDDGGYGDLTYDPNTDTYRVVTYKGNQEAADLKQYNFKVNWTT
jgi:Neuraminidase (sialidase)